ncbi:hypothetical protein PCE1_000542 [Barthelona sp. PCE]
MVSLKLQRRPADKIAKTFEQQEEEIDSLLQQDITIINRTDFGVILDLDGVLVKGNERIARSNEAYSLLHSVLGNNLIMMTNSGRGVPEYKANTIKRITGLNTIAPERLFLCHSPIRLLIEQGFNGVACITGECCPYEIAEHHGLRAISTEDIKLLYPDLCPLDPVVDRTVDDIPYNIKETGEKIEAVFMVNDTSKFFDIQIIVDILLTDGDVYGARVHKHGYSGPQKVKLYVANPDLHYKGTHSENRMTVGSFMRCVEAIWNQYTDKPLEWEGLGKPCSLAYENCSSAIGNIDPKRLYMVGDNPESDIRGGNAAGMNTILVRTGCYTEDMELDEGSTPTIIVDDLYAAVEYIFEQECVKQ